MPGQFENDAFALGKEVPLFPPDDRTAIDSNSTGKLLLGEVPAFAERL
jgi:hypothetical protein